MTLKNKELFISIYHIPLILLSFSYSKLSLAKNKIKKKGFDIKSKN